MLQHPELLSVYGAVLVLDVGSCAQQPQDTCIVHFPLSHFFFAALKKRSVIFNSPSLKGPPSFINQAEQSWMETAGKSFS